MAARAKTVDPVLSAEQRRKKALASQEPLNELVAAICDQPCPVCAQRTLVHNTDVKHGIKIECERSLCRFR
jgi:hypothetical protein